MARHTRPETSVIRSWLGLGSSKTPRFLPTIKVSHTPRPLPPRGFRVNANVHRQLNRRKRRILRRIENKPGVERQQPMMSASNIHYEIGEKVRGIAPGGIEAIHLLACKIGLIRDIDRPRASATRSPVM